MQEQFSQKHDTVTDDPGSKPDQYSVQRQAKLHSENLSTNLGHRATGIPVCGSSGETPGNEVTGETQT